MSSIDHIVPVVCTDNSLAAKWIPNSGRQAQTNSRTAQKCLPHSKSAPLPKASYDLKYGFRHGDKVIHSHTQQLFN